MKETNDCANDISYSQECNLHYRFCTIFPGGAFRAGQRLLLDCLFDIATIASKISRIKCDGTRTPLGIKVTQPTMYLDADTVGTIKYLHQLLTGQTDQVVTCVDWRDPACQGVNRFLVHELQRIADGEEFREEHQLRYKFGEQMSRAVFIKNGGVGHALYLTGDIFNPCTSVCRKTCLLYSALTKATCSNYGNAIALFKKIMFTEPTEELKHRMIIPY